jgi:hypothetical protein
METLQSPNIQLFILNNTTLLSLVEIPGMDADEHGYVHNTNGDLNASSDSGLILTGGGVPSSQVRIILRDISGKFVWDTSVINTPLQSSFQTDQAGGGDDRHALYRSAATFAHPPNVPPPPFPIAPAGSGVGGGSIFSPPRHTKRHRPPSELPTYEAAASDLDQLDDLLQYLGHTAPELLSAPGRPLNSVATWPMAPDAPPNLEGDLISSVIGQRNLEQEQLVRYGGGGTASYLRAGRPAAPPELTAVPEPEPFQQARILFQQLGLSSWEKRPHIQLVKKTEQLGQYLPTSSCFTI